MNIYTVSFFGHRRIYDQLRLDGELDELIIRLLREHSYVEFLVCRDGDFDQLVSSAIRRCQREYGVKNSSHVWFMPYPTAFFRDNEEACYSTMMRLKSVRILRLNILRCPSKLETGT